jgi:hypothetical protein
MTNKLVPIPKKIQIEQFLDQTTITVPWYIPTAWFLLFFSLFWNSIVFSFLFIMPFPAIFLLVFHVAAGISMSWYTLCLFFNKTTIVITPRDFSLSTKPIFAFGYRAVTINRGDFKQIYVREHKKRSKNGANYQYKLHLLENNDRSRELPFSCTDPEQALFIRHEIEKIMRIEHQAVEGEL